VSGTEQAPGTLFPHRYDEELDLDIWAVPFTLDTAQQFFSLDFPGFSLVPSLPLPRFSLCTQNVCTPRSFVFVMWSQEAATWQQVILL
jgi:hypothetical protein